MQLLVLVLCFIAMAAAGQLECPAHGNSEFRLSVVSRRNSTGHWTAQVHFDHGAESPGEEPWTLDLEHKSTKCGDTESVTVDAVVTSPGVDSHTKIRRSDYELIPGFGYYKMHVVASTWLQGLRTCANEDAHLLILNSEAEVRALLPFFSRHPKTLNDWRNNVFYIGIHDFFADGTYMTIFSE
ncbi:hypothetical protein L9F63_017991 [Diploptera punctata]|uniref:Uncharacterized protein n=1 Tax=Diploptera punctata TaxID=6984 RepID=A0AAD8EGG7_DIPPU|nr:hypothetical protein L9F63_017991 [Diploptera punctata]